MPHYMKLGEIPHKRHTQFRRPDGSLFAEELVSTEGFSDIYSLVYHHYPPTIVTQIDPAVSVAPVIAVEKNLQHRSFLGFRVRPADDYLESRVPVLVNNDLHILLAAPKKSMTGYFFKNSGADEMVFVHKGEGTLKTVYGNIPFRKGDHLIIPRGTIHRFDFNGEDNRLFIVESFSPIRYPRRYVNKMGQLLEHSPYCERDIRGPEILETHDERGISL